MKKNNITKVKCKVCGNKFEALAINRYTARKFCFPSVTLHDAFDCPICGCQCIVGIREETVGIKEDTDNEVQPDTCDC